MLVSAWHDWLHRRHRVWAAGPPRRDDSCLAGTYCPALPVFLCQMVSGQSICHLSGKTCAVGCAAESLRCPTLRCTAPSSGMQVSATLRADAVPALPGATEVLKAGIASSLVPSNAAAAKAAVGNAAEAAQHARWSLLLDPQTGRALFMRRLCVYKCACCCACTIGCCTCEVRSPAERQLQLHTSALQVAGCWPVCLRTGRQHALRSCSRWDTDPQPSLVR
jgi:hypothetical protein